MPARIEYPKHVLAVRTAYPVSDGFYPRITSGKGPYLFSEGGELYLDASCGSGSMILGHGDVEIIEALEAQVRKLAVFPSKHFSVEIVERYIGELAEFGPDGLGHATTFSSGSDAVEAAIKLTLQYNSAVGRSKKTKIIGRQGSYHGNTLAGLSAGGFLSRRKPFEEVLGHTTKASLAHCGACQFHKVPATCELECAKSIEEAIILENPETVAAVLIEPVVGAALSAVAPDARYLSEVRRICDRHDVLLVFDEVMTGFGRLGAPFGCQLWSVTPDILICGKGISAGYFPLSALLTSHRIAAVFDGTAGPFQNGHTHACNPVGSAVGLAVLQRLRREPIYDNARAMGLTLRARLRELTMSGVISNIRGEGLMVGFDVDTRHGRGPTRRSQDEGASNVLQRAALRHGLLVYASSGGANTEAGDHAMLLPPLNIEKQHIDFIVMALTAAIENMRSGSRVDD